MATFTDAEYADSLRIQRGYDQLLRSFVPYALDPSFGHLNNMITFRDEILGVNDRVPGYKAIDGIEKIKLGTVSSKLAPTEILEKVSGGTFEDVVINDTQDLLKYLVQQSSLSENGEAILFLRPHSQADIFLGISIQGQEIQFIRNESFAGDSKWLSATCQLTEGQDGLNLDDSKLAKSLADVLKEISRASLPPGSNSLQILKDTGSIDLNLIQRDFEEVSQATKSSEIGMKSCLMMTQDWVRPALEFRENMPFGSQQPPQTLQDAQAVENPNCVEIATAIGLNSVGGVNGKLVKPMRRVLPSTEALRDGSIVSSLELLDPLHHQTLQGRVFGNEVIQYGFGLEVTPSDVSESGSIVSVYGHTFYARRVQEAQVDVYDLALGFTGDLGDYQMLLQAMGISSSLRRTTEVRPYDQGRTDFHRAIRAAFKDDQVISKTNEIFNRLKEEQKTDESLWQSWNQALSESPKIIGEHFGVGVAIGEVSPGDPSPDLQAIEEMIKTQEKGFICLREVSTLTEPPKQNIVLIFKDGQDAYVAQGRWGGRCDDLDKALSSNQCYNYQVLSYGGADLDQMKSLYAKGIQAAASLSEPEIGFER